MILWDNRPANNITTSPSPQPTPRHHRFPSPPLRAPRGFLRRRQERSEVATDSRVPRASRPPRHDTSRQRHRASSAPPRPTGRRVPPGTWVRRTLTLSVEIPQTTRNVLPQNLAGLDGMQLITRIRNKLVHPSTAAPLAPDTFYEVWKLSMWYIECAILRIAGYTGKHANRVSQSRVGQVEPMP